MLVTSERLIKKLKAGCELTNDEQMKLILELLKKIESLEDDIFYIDREIKKLQKEV